MNADKTKPFRVPRAHALTVDAVLVEINSSPEGLVQDEVNRRQEVFGPNRLSQGTK